MPKADALIDLEVSTDTTNGVRSIPFSRVSLPLFLFEKPRGMTLGILARTFLWSSTRKRGETTLFADLSFERAFAFSSIWLATALSRRGAQSGSRLTVSGELRLRRFVAIMESFSFCSSSSQLVSGFSAQP